MKNPFDMFKQMFGNASETSADEMLTDANETSLEINDDAFIDGDISTMIAGTLVTDKSMKL